MNKQDEIRDWFKYLYDDAVYKQKHGGFTGLWQDAYTDVLTKLETKPTDEELLSWLKQKFEEFRQMAISMVYKSAITILTREEVNNEKGK